MSYYPPTGYYNNGPSYPPPPAYPQAPYPTSQFAPPHSSYGPDQAHYLPGQYAQARVPSPYYRPHVDDRRHSPFPPHNRRSPFPEPPPRRGAEYRRPTQSWEDLRDRISPAESRASPRSPPPGDNRHFSPFDRSSAREPLPPQSALRPTASSSSAGGGSPRNKKNRRKRAATPDRFDEDAWLKEDIKREERIKERYLTDMASGMDTLPAGMEDYHDIRGHLIYALTVDRLKQAIRYINSRNVGGRSMLKLSGNKGELIDRIRGELQGKMLARDLAGYNAIKQCLLDSGMSPSSIQSSRTVAPLPPSPVRQAPTYNPPTAPRAHYNGPQASGSGAPGLVNTQLPITFRPSPFFKPISACMSRLDLPISPQGDRRNPVSSISVTADQKAKLLASKASALNTQYQIRLYGCTETFFSTSFYHPSGQQSRGPAAMEFPAACEVKVNGTSIGTSKLKGIKKKEGSTAPPDLTSYLDLNKANKIDVVYVNTDKRYCVIAYLVEVTSVDALVAQVKKGKYRSKQDVIEQMRRSALDDEISATSSELSLKDPLTFARITTPARGVHCQHLQSFELNVFLLSNEQTPTWECPVCSQTIRFDDLVIDGYMEDILENTSDAHESVIVDADGVWATAGDKTRSVSAPQHASGDGGPDSEDGEYSDSDVLITKDSRAPAIRASTASAPINIDGTSPAGTPAARGSTQPPVFIDLTASDDEDSSAASNNARPLNPNATSFNSTASNPLKRTGDDLYDPRDRQRQRWDV